MSVLYKTNVEESISNKPNASTAFNLAASATQADGLRNVLAAYADTEQLPYFVSDGAGLWEDGIGTVTGTTLVRAVINESSNSDSVVDFSGGGALTLIVGAQAKNVELSRLAATAIDAGGRLTLESGVPISTTDQLLKTNIFFTPYRHNIIVLFDGVQWSPVEFLETSLALGTVTASTPYDVFGFLNSGVLELEKLAWTNDTTRATDISLQDGRYCKSGDKTRLYLGSFYTTSTTETEDSQPNRFLYSHYNKNSKDLFVQMGATHTYTTTTLREWGGIAGAATVNFFDGLGSNVCSASIKSRMKRTDFDICGYVSISHNQIGTDIGYIKADSQKDYRLFISKNYISSNGLNYFVKTQYGTAGVSFEGITNAFLEGVCQC